LPGCLRGVIGRRPERCRRRGRVLSRSRILWKSPGDLIAEGLAVAIYMLQKGIVTTLGFLFPELLLCRAPRVDPTPACMPGLLCGASAFPSHLPLGADFIEPRADRSRLRRVRTVGRRG